MDCTFFFFQAEDGIRDGRVTGVQTCALPICPKSPVRIVFPLRSRQALFFPPCATSAPTDSAPTSRSKPICATLDRKSTRLNSSHPSTSYAVFCLKKKKKNYLARQTRMPHPRF